MAAWHKIVASVVFVVSAVCVVAAVAVVVAVDVVAVVVACVVGGHSADTGADGCRHHGWPQVRSMPIPTGAATNGAAHALFVFVNWDDG